MTDNTANHNNPDSADSVMRKRLGIWIVVVVLIVIAYTVYTIFTVSVRDSKSWQSLANSQQLKSTVVQASRGTIYDSNGSVLAQSATVYTVFADPVMLKEQFANKDTTVKELKELIASEKDAKKLAVYKEKLKKALTGDACLQELTEFLATKLKVDTDTVKTKLTNTDTRYAIIKKEVEKTLADKISAKLSELGIEGVSCEAATKRIYPQNSISSSVLGFTDYDGNGTCGLEAYYDDYLAGIDGRTITAKARNGSEIPYRYKQSYDAQDGDNLNLNIDSNIQYVLEKELAAAVKKTNPTDRACGIIMNPNDGSIYAMATSPSFDESDPSVITDEKTAAELAKLDKNSAAYKKKRLEAWSLQWKNKAVSEIYNPGSVFKVITASAALEEKAITLTDKFSCNTQITVEDTTFHCWSFNDHGSQTLAKAMLNSCNPVFIQIGLKLGAKKFVKYYDAFGFNELTGIDLPGESNSISMPLSNMGSVQLSSCSFGQTNKITPMQMITAYSAAINGGYLVTPHVVNNITDTNGNVVKSFGKTVKRQVISAQTSKTMRSILMGVVNGEPASNCYIQGYKIGGKSGTSQKLDEDVSGNTYVGSYCAFVPADNPQLVMLVMVDHPTGTEFYGSRIAAPVCVNVLTEVLPYMGYFPEYTAAELKTVQVSVPSVAYYTVAQAKKTLEALGLTTKIKGNGKTILKQYPSSVKIENGGSVVLYTDNSYKTEMVTVPSLQGLTIKQAQTTLESYGLNLTANGSGAEETGAVAQTDQSYTAGQSVPMGTAVSVTFSTSTIASQ